MRTETYQLPGETLQAYQDRMRKLRQLREDPTSSVYYSGVDFASYADTSSTTDYSSDSSSSSTDFSGGGGDFGGGGDSGSW